MSQKVSVTKDISPYYGTFSGGDIIAYALFPDSNPIVLGELTTVTYSIHRDKTPVRPLGRISPKGFANGTRTVAGTLIFTVLTKHVINKLRTASQVKGLLGDIKRFKTDELPPFDIIISFGNEYGASAKMAIYGVTIVDEGKVMSIEDMYTENTMSYMAHDIDLMDDISQNDFITSSRSRTLLSKLTHVNAKFTINSNGSLTTLDVVNPRDEYIYQPVNVIPTSNTKLNIVARDPATLVFLRDAIIRITLPDSSFLYGKTDANGIAAIIVTTSGFNSMPVSIQATLGVFTNTVSNVTVREGQVNTHTIWIERADFNTLDKVSFYENSPLWPSSGPQALPNLSILCYNKNGDLLDDPVMIQYSYHLEPDPTDFDYISKDILKTYNLEITRRRDGLRSMLTTRGYSAELNYMLPSLLSSPSAYPASSEEFLPHPNPLIPGSIPLPLPKTFELTGAKHYIITISAMVTQTLNDLKIFRTAQWSKSTKVLR